MNIKCLENEQSITYFLEGSLDPNTSTELLEQVNITTSKEVIFDFSEVDYVYSAGLRAFLQIQKNINAYGGKIKLINMKDSVKQVFDIVGFTNIMNIA